MTEEEDIRYDPVDGVTINGETMTRKKLERLRAEQKADKDSVVRRG